MLRIRPSTFDVRHLPRNFYRPFDRASLLSDRGVSVGCMSPLQLHVLVDGSYCYQCEHGPSSPRCACQPLFDVDAVDRAVWRQILELRPEYRGARTARAKRELVAREFGLAHVDTSRRERPVDRFFTHRELLADPESDGALLAGRLIRDCALAADARVRAA